MSKLSSRRRLTKSLEVKQVTIGSQRSINKQQLPTQIKSKYVDDLQQRNRRLKVEIIKIRELLVEHEQRQGKRQDRKLIPWQASMDVLKKQLQNAYKLIRNYEKQVSKLQDRQTGGLVAQKLSRLQNVMKEKDSHIQKLKNQLAVVQKESFDIGRKLKNNFSKQELEDQLLKMQQEIRYLRENVRESETKEKKKQQNAKRQYDYIKRIEKELIEGGVSVDELEELKKNNIFNVIFDKASDSSSIQGRVVKNNKKTIEQPEEQVTLTKYHDVRNQIKIKRKLQQDYEKRLEGLNKDKEEDEKKTIQTRMKLIQRQNEIVQLEDQIKVLKKKIKKSNLKPSVNSILVDSSQGKPPLSKQKQKPKQQPLINKKPVKDPLENHGPLKFDEKGVLTQRGKKFTDRSILGRNYQTKIIRVKLWIEKNQFNVCGIQCTYKFGDTTKQGGQHVIKKEGRQLYTQNLYELEEDDYLKSVSGALSQDNMIEYLVLISAKLKIARFGVINPTQKQFNFDIEQNQLPVCIYGSLIPRSTQPGKPDISSIEFLGFEITQDTTPKQDSVDNI